MPLPSRIEESFRRRLDALPAETRRLLLVAAAEPVGDPVLLWRAAERLGIEPEAAAPAADGRPARARRAGAVPSSAGALGGLPGGVAGGPAGACIARWRRRPIPSVDPDRRAWHRAQAAPGPDEDVAAELERSAGRAQARGGLAAAAAFLERAAALTPDPARRAAARAGRGAGQARRPARPTRRSACWRRREAGPLDELQRARVDLLRGQIAFAVSRGSDAPPLLLEAAKRLEPLDVDARARDLPRRAVGGDRSSAVWPSGGGVLEVAEAARAAPPAPEPPRAADLLLDGLALLITDGLRRRRADAQAGAERLPRARTSPGEEALRWLWLASRVAA